MIRKLYVLPLLLVALSFVACDETKEPGKYDNWRERNEAFIDSLQQVYDLNKGSDGLKRVQYSRDKNVYIYYKELTKSILSPEPVNTEKPFYTSKVKMVYRGMYINEKVFATAKPPYHYTELYEGLDVFSSNMKGAYYDPEFDPPFEISVSAAIGGWGELLQLMVPGNRWEAYVPYQAGYGANGGRDPYGNVTVLGYSALIFDMEMLDVEYYPKTK